MKIFALCTTALAADAFSPVKESWKTGTAADGFQAHFDMTLDDNGFDGVAGLTVGLPSTSCNDAHPQCREFKQNREVVLSGANSPFGDDGPLAEISLVTTLTARTTPCNILNMELDFEAELNVALASTQTCDSCDPILHSSCFNFMQCLYDTDKGTFNDYCQSFDGSPMKDGYCNKMVIPAIKSTYKVDFSKEAYALTLKLSDLLEESGAGPVMKALGTDVTWSITPGSIITAFTGFQFEIQMETTVMDMSKIPGLDDIPGTDDIYKSIGMTQDAAGDYVVYDDRDNFLALIEKAIPSADLPAFLSKKKGAITVGDVSDVCEKKPVQYGITVSGVQKSALTQAAVGKALSTAINTELAKAKATLKLPTCDSNTDSFTFPSTWPPTDAVKKAASSLICMVDTGATTFEENADGSLTVSGNLNAGAGHNAQALQAAMVAAVADGSVKIGAGTVGKDVTGYTKCTAAQCTAAGKYAEQTCGAGVCGGSPGPSPPAPTPPAPTPSPKHHGSSNAGKDVGIVIGAMCVVGICAALFMKSKKKKSEKEELLGHQYIAHTDEA